MVSKLLLSALLLALAHGAGCPVFACDYTLGTDMCATLTDSGIFHINGNGCESDSYCSALSMEIWAMNPNATSSTTYFCQKRDPFPVSLITTDTFSYEACPSKMTSRTFKAGTTLVLCESSNDCLMTDDTVAECICVARDDAKGICLADLSNELVYGGFWTACGDLNRIDNFDEYNYWMAYINSWMWLQSNLTCLRTFIELETLDQTTLLYNSASLLPLGLLALLH